MSGLVMGLVWEQPITVEFGRAEKYVLLAYADHADQNGMNIYPSVELIAKKTGYDERSVQRLSRSLEGLGFLVADGQGRSGTNRWRIPLERVGEGVKLSPLPLILSPEGMSPPGVGVLSPEGMSPEGMSPEPSVEVKLEPSESTTVGGRGEIFRIYENEIGSLTPMIADAIQDAEKTYPAAWLPAAIREAASHNKRNWKYCEAILKRWKIEGFQAGKVKETKPLPGKPAKISSNDDVIRQVASGT